MPRHARHLIPRELPRRREAIAASVLLIVGFQLLLAPLTIAFAGLFATVTRVSRWRLWWLAAPAAAGLIWMLLTGPGAAAAGFAAGPAQVLRYLGGGQLIARLSRLSGAFGGAGHWLPAQLPLALVAGAAQAAVIGWLGWLHTDEWAVPPARPGAVAALRTAIGIRLIRAGAVLTRDGCALGVAEGTGAVVSLSWTEAAGGVLVTGASARAATVTSLQFAHAALRRRKPLIVLDLSDGPAVAAALAAACAATGVPLHAPVTEDADLGQVVSARSAVLVRPASTAEARRACADIAALAARLGQIGADADGLVWVCDAGRLPTETLAALLPCGATAGLPVLFSTSSPTAAMELADLVGAILTHRLAAADCATHLASHTGIRWRPPAVAQPPVPPMPAAHPQLPSKPSLQPRVRPGSGDAYEPAGSLADVPAGPGLVPFPAVSARTLLSLGPSEFVLAVSSPRHRLVALGHLVPARLPPTALPAWRAGANLPTLATARQSAVITTGQAPELGWRGTGRDRRPEGVGPAVETCWPGSSP
jgi:hypothetical protein